MIPESSYMNDVEEEDLDVNEEFEETESEMPSLTYAIDFEKNTLSGTVDELEAVKQAVYCILHTERYEHEIYDWDYGVELKDLYGEEQDYVVSEIKERISEALLQDDRIEDVSDFEIEVKGESLRVSFTVYSQFGNFDMDEEVELSV